MKKLTLALFGIVCAAMSVASGQTRSSPPLRVEMSYSSEVSAGPLDGRMFLYISKDISGGGGRGGREGGGGTTEPRLQVSDNTNSQQFFGIDVDGLKPGAPAIFDSSIFGYPLASLRDIPASDYYVQGMLNIYTTFHRSDGHTVKLPMDEARASTWSESREIFTVVRSRFTWILRQKSR
jgi:hypothetical protein